MPAPFRHAFYRKQWIHAPLVALLPIGLLVAGLGVGFWTGRLTDARGEQRIHDAPWMVGSSLVCATMGLNSLIRLIMGRSPIILLTQQGLELNVPVDSPLIHAPLPKKLKAVLFMLSFQSLRHRTIGLPWKFINHAVIEGPMLDQSIHVRGTNDEGFAVDVPLHASLLSDPLREIALSITAFAQHPELRAQLPAGSITPATA